MENLLVVGGILSCLLVLYSAAAFFIARITADNSVMDVLYGPAFAITISLTIYLTNTYTFLPALLTCCITLWASRLAVRIGRKNWGKPEDVRYAAWRKTWMERGRSYFLIRSYLQVNLLQCFIILLVALPAVVAISFPEEVNWWFTAAGLLVFLIGLGYEGVADWQLDRFISDKRAGRTTETLMTRGLFRFSRRPNYFGESVVWWGLAIMVLPLPFGFIALVSPLLITYIVTRVTGPMLERHFLKMYPEEYKKYMETTNYFVPGRRKMPGKA